MPELIVRGVESVGRSAIDETIYPDLEEFWADLTAAYREEISRTLAYLGCRNIAELNRDCLEYVPTPHVPLTP